MIAVVRAVGPSFGAADGISAGSSGPGCGHAGGIETTAILQGGATAPLASPLKRLVGRLQVAIVVVGLVVLVSAIFSVVGTISCCVVFGMMLGSLRASKWDTILISMLFPVVTIVLLQFPAPAVPLPKAILMAGVTFATFWGVCLLTHLLMLAEKRGKSPDSADGRMEAGQQGAGPPLDPELTALQGRWVNVPDEPGLPTEAIEFVREAVRLERLDPHRRVPFSAGGRAHCETLGPFKTISVSDPRMSPRPGGSPNGCETWIYAIVSGELIIASHFEGDSAGPPIVRQYRKVARNA